MAGASPKVITKPARPYRPRHVARAKSNPDCGRPRADSDRVAEVAHALDVIQFARLESRLRQYSGMRPEGDRRKKVRKSHFLFFGGSGAIVAVTLGEAISTDARRTQIILICCAALVVACAAGWFVLFYRATKSRPERSTRGV